VNADNRVVLTIGTHDGRFHADESFALAVLRRLYPNAAVIRTRDPEELRRCDIQVDVGGSFNSETGHFDHHMLGGAGDPRLNGIPYASFGLVWRQYGLQICGDQQVVDLVDQGLVQVVDADDCGVDISREMIADARPYTVSDVIARVNPTWAEEGFDLDESFQQAVNICQGILEREIAKAFATVSAEALTREALASAEDPQVVVFDVAGPWDETLTRLSTEALVYVSPDSSGWKVHCVPVRIGSFANRCPLPESWAGKTGPELVKATGVSGSVFCHAKRFLVVAETKYAALALARKAVL